MTTDDGLKGFAPSLEPYCFIVEPKESDDYCWPWNIHKTAEQCEHDIEEGRIVIPVYRHPALKAANVHDSGEVSYEVWQDGMCVAGASGDGALDEAHHYAMMYGQDGPVTVYRVTTTRAILAEKGRYD